MKRKGIIGMFGMLLISGMLFGCAKTPEDSLIKQKGEDSLKNYEEGEKISENRLRAALNAPKHYKSEIQDETGKLQILTDADVEIPDAAKVSAVAVSQHPFDQALMDRITDTFFPDAVFYTADSYYRMDQADYQKQIELLKGYAAEGNLDPYGYGTDENGNLYFDIYQRIENLENAYQEAPKTKELREIHPQFGLESDDGKGGTYVDENSFLGVAVTEDGKKYDYRVNSWGCMPMEIQIQRIYEDVDRRTASFWAGYDGMKTSYSEVPDEETLKKDIGISYEEAKALADEKVSSLEIPFMEEAEWEYVLLWANESGYTRESQIAAGYQFHYTRKINNIPITYTMSAGGALEDMDSEMVTWCYEILDLVVTKDGISEVHYGNLYDLDEVKTENLNLMPFEEIMKIYEKMMLIQNADVLTFENNRTYKIDRITFGYSRIYEPSTSAFTGVLVPVWDFFGGFSCSSEYDGEEYHMVNSTKYQSYLTINAVDGSIIDRELGY